MATYYVSPGYVAEDYYQTDVIINWATGEIFVPKFFTTLVQTDPIEVRNLDIDIFRLKLNDLEDNDIGMVATDTHTHNTEVTLSGIVYSRVIEIIAPYTITFEDGQYAVNLVGANSNIADKVNINNVGIRSANSAGLQNLNTILATSYQGVVAVDKLNTTGFAQAGLPIPIGTRAVPSDNFSDAINIAKNNSIKSFQLISSATLTANDFSDGYNFIGDSAITIVLTLESAANVVNCEFRNLTVTGVLDGGNTLRECSIQNLTYTYGFLFQCAITGGIVIAPGARCSIFECYSDPLSLETAPTIDIGGTGSLTAHHLAGDFKIINSGGTGDIYLGMDGGTLTLDSTITGGIVYVYGTATVVNNTTGTTTVVDNTIAGGGGASGTNEEIAQAVWDHII